MKNNFLFLVLAATLAANAGAAATDPGGTVVVAKPDGDALILWDVTPLVGTVSSTIPQVNSLRILESQAVGVMNMRLPGLINAHTVSVRVFYLRTGAVNPIYKAETVSGVENVVTIRAAVTKLKADASSWAKQLRDGKTPKDLEVMVTGELPPS